MEFYMVDFCELPVPDTFTPVAYDPTLDSVYPTMLVLSSDKHRLTFESGMPDGEQYPLHLRYSTWYAIAHAQYHGDRRKHEMVPAFVTT